MQRSLIITSTLLWLLLTEGVSASLTTGVYYTDAQKYQIAQEVYGSQVYMSRSQVLRGRQQGVAAVLQRRLENWYGGHMVCNWRRVSGVVMVFCARPHKLQYYLRSHQRVFRMKLQPYLQLGVAPVFVDFGLW